MHCIKTSPILSTIHILRVSQESRLPSKNQMGESMDFVEWLGLDMSLEIFTSLDDPFDLLRTSAVSRSWREFVIGNGLCKMLCLRKCPEVASFARVVVVEPRGTGVGGSGEWDCLEREHRVYASLGRELITSGGESCITEAVCASSTDRYPDESIKNTLEPSDGIFGMALYWSSKGAADPSASETLIYKLASQLCLITELHVHPFQAYFQFGSPIYSPIAVRFHMGYSKDPLEIDYEETEYHDEMFVWTYSSPEFPMAQENSLQKFKLPKPILCIGGILKVELLGRLQTQEADGLYYTCIDHVQAIGLPLSPAFEVEMIGDEGKCTLKYDPSVDISETESSGHGAGPLIDDYDSDNEYLY